MFSIFLSLALILATSGLGVGLFALAQTSRVDVMTRKMHEDTADMRSRLKLKENKSNYLSHVNKELTADISRIEERLLEFRNKKWNNLSAQDKEVLNEFEDFINSFKERQNKVGQDISDLNALIEQEKN